jgi:hypothetical protein
MLATFWVVLISRPREEFVGKKGFESQQVADVSIDHPISDYELQMQDELRACGIAAKIVGNGRTRNRFLRMLNARRCCD